MAKLFRTIPGPGDETDEEFERLFGEWLEQSVGIPRRLWDSLDNDDDWTFVIKMHGILEAGLNHLLITRLGDWADDPNKLARIVSRLDTIDSQRGKIAFINAYGLLSPDARLFVKLLSEFVMMRSMMLRISGLI
jgi:hypothetical protein